MRNRSWYLDDTEDEDDSDAEAEDTPSDDPQLFLDCLEDLITHGKAAQKVHGVPSQAILNALNACLKAMQKEMRAPTLVRQRRAASARGENVYGQPAQSPVQASELGDDPDPLTPIANRYARKWYGVDITALAQRDGGATKGCYALAEQEYRERVERRVRQHGR